MFRKDTKQLAPSGGVRVRRQYAWQPHHTSPKTACMVAMCEMYGGDFGGIADRIE